MSAVWSGVPPRAEHNHARPGCPHGSREVGRESALHSSIRARPCFFISPPASSGSSSAAGRGEVSASELLLLAEGDEELCTGVLVSRAKSEEQAGFGFAPWLPRRRENESFLASDDMRSSTAVT